MYLLIFSTNEIFSYSQLKYQISVPITDRRNDHIRDESATDTVTYRIDLNICPRSIAINKGGMGVGVFKNRSFY